MSVPPCAGRPGASRPHLGPAGGGSDKEGSLVWFCPLPRLKADCSRPWSAAEPRLERTREGGRRAQLVAAHRAPHKQTPCLRAVSERLLSTSGLGAVTSLCQHPAGLRLCCKTILIKLCARGPEYVSIKAQIMKPKINHNWELVYVCMNHSVRYSNFRWVISSCEP